jgi:DNA-directed RNA polymerase specialized sigma24 family protein
VEVVHDCVADAALALMRHTSRMPRSLTGYLIAALRHGVANEHRALGRRTARDGLALVATGAREVVVIQTCSEASLRASAGPDWDVAPVAPPLERLAAALDEALDDEERRLLGWIGQWVPQTQIAEWLGVSYGALRARVSRLRSRLHATAERHAGQLQNDERRRIQQFFRRAAGVSRVAEPPAEWPLSFETTGRRAARPSTPPGRGGTPDSEEER